MSNKCETNDSNQKFDERLQLKAHISLKFQINFTFKHKSDYSWEQHFVSQFSSTLKCDKRDENYR